MNYWLLLIPFTTAISCWLVSKAIIWLVFYPAAPKKIAGITIQGVIPSLQQGLAVKAGEMAAGLLPLNSIKEKLAGPESFEKIRPVVEEQIDDFLRNKLKSQMPMIAMFIGDKTIESLKKVFMTELERIFPMVIGQYANNFLQDLNLEQTVQQKISSVPLNDVKKAFDQHAGTQLGKLSLASFVFGFLTGSITAGILCLLQC